MCIRIDLVLDVKVMIFLQLLNHALQQREFFEGFFLCVMGEDRSGPLVEPGFLSS